MGVFILISNLIFYKKNGKQTGGMAVNRKVTEKDKAGMALKILIAFITGIYPLLLFKVDMGNFHVQSFLLFLSAMGVLLYSFLLISSKQWEFPRPQSRPEIAILVLALYALIRIVIKVITASGTETVNFDFEIMVLALTAIYLLIAARPVFEEKYFDIVLFSGLIVFALLLIQYLYGENTDSTLTILLQDKTGVASYTMLVCMAGLWQYLRCEDKMRSFFYLGVLAIGFLILLINQNRTSIWLMAMVFIAIPVLQRPTAELVKRDMQMFFLYLFMLCNMSLITDYTNLLQAETSYDLEQSVYFELLIVIGGIFFFRYWERIPEGVDLKRLVMRKMRRGYQFLLNLTGIVFAGVLLGGKHWQQLQDGMMLNVVKGFAVPLVEEVMQSKNTFYLCFEWLGVTGSLIILIMCVLLVEKLKKGYGFDKPVTSMLILISGVFLIQLLFWNISIITLPIYWVFLILAITYKEEKIKVISSKIKFE